MSNGDPVPESQSRLVLNKDLSGRTVHPGYQPLIQMVPSTSMIETECVRQLL